jgi:hypothetical protein
MESDPIKTKNENMNHERTEEMKRKHIALPADTRAVIDTPAGNRLNIYRKGDTLIVDTENLISLRNAVASGDVTLQGIDPAALVECVTESLKWMEEMEHHLPPARHAALMKHLEICRITLKRATPTTA